MTIILERCRHSFLETKDCSEAKHHIQAGLLSIEEADAAVEKDDVDHSDVPKVVELTQGSRMSEQLNKEGSVTFLMEKWL